MYNWLVVEVFNEIADLLDIKGESSFRSAAYRRAARAVERLPRDIRQIMEEQSLTEVSGIGDALAEKIREVLTTGTCSYLERLRGEVPTSLLELLELPGVGPRTVSSLYNELGITTLEELAEVANSGRLRDLKGFGKKTEQNIVDGLAKLSERSRHWLLAMALPIADELVLGLKGLESVKQVAIAGSTRRCKERVSDIDIVAAVDGDRREGVRNMLTSLEVVSDVVAAGDTRVSIVVNPGLQVDVRLVDSNEFVSTLHHFTGSKEHNVALRGLAKHQGYKLNEYGFFDSEGDRIVVESETDLYSRLELEYIPPELREGAGEIEAARAGTLPKLVTLGDIRGDLHMHTLWSDGTAKLEDMIIAAREFGYEYIAISDHSQSLIVANGLTPERLAEQGIEIERYNADHTDIRVLRSIEVDIMADGSLDFDDDVLAELDLVTASVHSRFRQDEKTMTERIMRAMENPHVDVIGHLTGRLLNRRDPYALDVDRVIEKAAETGTALEINASPERLDIDDVTARKAKDAGVWVVVNTDAHAIRTLGDMAWGVNQARRGWLTRGDLLNCLPREELLELLARPKARRR